MQNPLPIFISCNNKSLADLLTQNSEIKISSNADINITEDDASISVNSKLFRKPLKIFEVIDYIKSLSKDNGLKLGNLEYFYTRKIILYSEHEISLTEKENELFNFLITTQKEVSTDQIMSEIWNYSSEVETTTLDTHLYRLRNKLESIGLYDLIITTKDGYKFSISLS